MVTKEEAMVVMWDDVCWLVRSLHTFLRFIYTSTEQ